MYPLYRPNATMPKRALAKPTITVTPAMELTTPGIAMVPTAAFVFAVDEDLAAEEVDVILVVTTVAAVFAPVVVPTAATVVVPTAAEVAAAAPLIWASTDALKVPVMPLRVNFEE